MDRLLFHRLIWERPAQGTATNYSLRFDSCSWSAHALQDLKATNSTAHSGSIYSSYTNTKMGQTDTWSMWADKLCCGRQTRAKLPILMISGSHVPNPLQGDVLNQLPPLMCMIWHQMQAKRPGIAATIQTSSFCVPCVFLMLHGLRTSEGLVAILQTSSFCVTHVFLMLHGLRMSEGLVAILQTSSFCVTHVFLMLHGLRMSEGLVAILQTS